MLIRAGYNIFGHSLTISGSARLLYTQNCPNFLCAGTSAIVNDRHRSLNVKELIIEKRLTRSEKVAKEEKEFIEENQKFGMKPGLKLKDELGEAILQEAIDLIKLNRAKAQARIIEERMKKEKDKLIELARKKDREVREKFWTMNYEAKKMGWKPPELRNLKEKIQDPSKVPWIEKLDKRTFTLGPKKYFVNLIRLNEDQSKIIFHLSKHDIQTKKQSHLHLSIDGAKKLLNKLKEVIEVIEKGNKESDDEKYEYDSSFHAKTPSENGDKEVEFNVKLETKNEENKLNTYLIVSNNLKNDKNTITIQNDAIQNITKAIEELLSNKKLKSTEAV
uniref:Mitochondrial ribosomal protein L46 n=1 Tax=Acrobeloides nanus TaxID=290746 RepID=A0A914EBE7_9BILA